MKANVQSSIDKAKKILKYDDYDDKVYFCTNENIDKSLKISNAYGKRRMLAVLASGDQLFSMLLFGASDIDSFDINDLTDFYALGFKRAMILKYNYHDYLNIMQRLYSTNISSEEVYEIIRGLYPHMERHHMLFWYELIDHDYLCQKSYTSHKNLIVSLTKGHNDFNIKGVSYLLNEENYNRVRKRLPKVNITFNKVNANDLDEHYAGPYDYVYLSNVLDYFWRVFGFDWCYDKLKKYEDGLRTLIDCNGVILLKYVPHYLNADSDLNPEEESSVLFKDSSFCVSECFESEEVCIFDYGNCNKDAIILIRK